MNFKEFEVEVLITFKKMYYIEADSWETACEVAEDNALEDDYDTYDHDCKVEANECVRTR